MSRYKDTCPQCGGEKDATAKVCRSCYTGGEPRSYPERHPRRADWPHLPNSPEPPDFSSVDPGWLKAFAGFFMADGYVGITKRDGGKYYNAALSLSLRADDKPLLDDVANRLGGTVRIAPPHQEHRGSVAHWHIGGLERVAAFCRLFLTCPLPAKKVRDAQLVLEFIEWRLACPWNWDDNMRAIGADFHQRLRDIRSFKEPSSQVISA